MPGPARVVLVGPGTPPGALTWPAWEALRSAPLLLDAGAQHWRPSLEQAGLVPSPVAVGTLSAALAEAAARGPVVALALVTAQGAAAWPDADVLVGAAELPGGALLEAVAVMDRLRSPGGCPWDAQQTHDSLRPYLLEEAYEALEAIEDGDPVALRGELGDVLLQVLFHARLGQEASPPWSVDDVAQGLVDKLVRRHPHVFAGAPADDLEGSWDALKAAEGRRSVTEGVPLGQPALSLAATLQRRATRLGAPVPAYGGLGGRLWDLVGQALVAGVDPEQALREVARTFRDALAAAEHAVREAGGDPAALTPQDWSRHLPPAPPEAGALVY